MLLLRISLLFAGFFSVNLYKLEVLTNNFFENLRGAPNLIDETNLSDGSKQFIETQIDNYIKLVTREESGSVKRKRSLLDRFTKNDNGTYMLDGIKPSTTIPVKFPVDITLFELNSFWFAAALESLSVKENANSLVIFSYANETFTETTRISIVNGSKLAAINTDNYTLIAVAENDSPKQIFHDKSGIYQFDGSGLIKIQSIDMHFANDIVMWRIHDEIYMSIAQFMWNKTGNIHYEVEIPIYKWLGKHFDLVQNVPSKGIRKITPFTVGNMNYLAIANFRDNTGNTRIYSEIYKFDYHTEKYELYQRILTRACTDIKVFSFSGNNHKKDTFLIVANLFEKDIDNNKNYETDSIIYKFVDDYFIPFQSIKTNAVEQWLPVEAPHNKFVLFASCRFDGLKSFQYNGWSFGEVPQKTTEILKGTGIKSIHFTTFNKTLNIVVSNKNNNGKIANVFRLEFIHENTLSELYDEMITWCDNGLEKVEDLVNSEIFEDVLGKAERADVDEELEKAQLEEIEEINSKIEALDSLLNQLNITKQLKEITADEIIFNNTTFTHNLKTTKINNLTVDEFLDNTLNIDEGFEVAQISFASIKIEDAINPVTINGYDRKTLLHGTDNITLDSVKVLGTVVTPSVEINGTLNGMIIDDQNLLLRVGDQNFSHPLTIKEAKIDKMTAKSLNNQNLATIHPRNESTKIHYIKNLTVKNLTIGGYINDIDVATLDKYALKKSGSQKITSDFIFDVLQGENLEVIGDISGRKLSDLIPIDSGNYTINQDLIFKSDIFVNNLQISDTINGIDVHDILLKDDQEEQEISGDKIFDDVIIYNAIYLQGHINSKNLEKMNPVVSITDSVFLEGDKTILGHVQIEDLINVKDVITSDGTYSLTKLENEGLRLDSKEIKPHLHFVQQLNVNDIIVDTINGQSPENFVVTGTENPQIIEGAKTFIGNLSITGGSNALKINNVDVEELENRVLRVTGDQIIDGKHHIKHLIANTILSNETKFDENLSSAVPDSENMIINGDLEADLVTAKTITVRGLINGLNFDDIINDTVTKDTNRVITGHKSFNTLNVDNLDVDNGFTFDGITDEIDQLTLEGPLHIENIKIDNLYFEEECNGVNRENFGKEDTSEGESTTVMTDHTFDTVIVYGKTFITSNKINNLDLGELAEETVKVDEPFEFNSVIFETDVVSKDPVHLDGHIEHFDFDNLVLSNDTDQTIFDEKTFSNLTINGTINFESYINGFNMTQFCKLTMGETNDKNLTVIGDAFFAKGPNVVKINGVDVKNIKDKGWFSEDDATITGSIEFEDVIFKNDIEVGGFVDNISLSLLHDNYFSKTKDQNVTATFSFENDLIFENNLTVPAITMNHAVVNGIDLDEFIHTALLNDYDQVFESPVFFENCYAEKITGEFLVNGLDLEKDVMRYDKVNMVTGTKIFENLNVEHLKLEKNIKIQEVDVLDWFKNSVLRTSSYNITGAKTFNNAIFANGLRLEGTLNGIKFDTENVMVKDIPQEISGTKIIYANSINPVLFKGIKLKGLLNDVDVSNLINNQVYKNQDNVFKTSLNLYNNITTNNLVIKKLYQGVNMSELISNITNLGFLNNLLDEYNNLLDMSYKLKKSIEGQAYFMHHYKIIQTIPFVSNSKKILCPDGITRIGTLVVDESGSRMDLYGWHEQQFLQNATIKFSDYPEYVDQVLMGRYLYSEGNDGTGHFIQMPISVDNTVNIQTNITIFTTSFISPTTQQPCTVFIYENGAPRIFCKNENNIEIMQILDSPNAEKASSISIKDTFYLIFITQPTKGLESRIDLWQLNNETAKFEIHQSLFTAHPRSIATTNYKGLYYLAVASGHLQNAMYSGGVDIYRYDETTSEFTPWQNFELDAPIQVEFSILPSKELVLYVLTDNPTEPLLIFRYEGIAGFRLSITGSALPQIMYMNQFVGGAGLHLIVAQSYDEINVIQAVFKGEI